MEKFSFVVQGPIIKPAKAEEGVYPTSEVLKSIRKFYPESEIVLSTWNGSDVSQLVYDKLVLSTDPGTIMINDVAINGNRLLISSRDGIAQASNRIVVKTRTDIIFTSSNLYNYLNQISVIDSPYSIFKNYILSTTYYVRNPLKFNWLFHPTDIFMIGEKDDMFSFFDVPVAIQDNFSDNEGNLKLVAEQYLLIENILKKRNKDYRLPKADFFDVDFFINSENYIFNNFRFFDVKELGVDFPARLYNVLWPNANYTLQLAQKLGTVYQNSAKYNMIIQARASRYVLKYYVWFGIKKVLKQLLGVIIEKKNNGNN